MRTANISRNTAETKILVEINLDGTGQYDNKTGIAHRVRYCCENKYFNKYYN